MDNYLNPETRRSITNFSIDTAQIAMNFLRKINNGETLRYSSLFDEEPEKAEVRTDGISQETKASNNDFYWIKANKDSVLNCLIRECIEYEIIPDHILKIDTKTGKLLKFVCVIYSNAEQFVALIKSKIKDQHYKLFLHQSFLQKDGDCYKLYYCLWTKEPSRVQDDTSDQSDNVERLKKELEMGKIISDYADFYFKDLPIEKKLDLIPKYRQQLRYETDEESGQIIVPNFEEVLQNMRQDSERPKVTIKS